MNDFIPDQFSSVQYASIGDAITLIKSLGRGCYMAKTDIKSAFRIIPIHPDDWAVLRLALYLKFLALRSSGLLNIISVLPAFCIFWMISCLLLPLKGNVPPI